MAFSYLLLGLCLKPTYSLRRQLLLSFGFAAAFTLIVVATAACICANVSGSAVSGRASDLLTEQVVRRLKKNSLYCAEAFSTYMYNIEGMVQLATDVVEDRIVGYPDAGWEDDTFVPFFDRETQRNKYPLSSPFLRMDWDIDANINPGNWWEHLQDVLVVPNSTFPRLSSIASFFMQGVCDPSERNPESYTYYKNCTSANNDYRTGGVVQPTSTNKALYEKAADIGALMKPIYEVQTDVSGFGVYFHNAGAGAVVTYPGKILASLVPTYISAGCEWMRERNPHTGRPFGTQQEIARCHPNGTVVVMREYNPMERAFCRDIALHGGMHWGKPYHHAERDIAVFPVGRAAFDRRTGNFIGCISFSIFGVTASEILQKSKFQEGSHLAVVRYSDGTVLADTLDGDSRVSFKITETGLITESDLAALRSVVEMRDTWTSRGDFMEELANNVVFSTEGEMFTAYPVPLPPENYDHEYEPEFLIIRKISSGVFNSEIEKEVLRTSLLSFGLAACGMLVILAIVWCVAGGLTWPLLWIESVAWGIVNHADQRMGESFNLSDFDKPKGIGDCLPATEISQLVHEFRTMIKGFSGKGASQVADADAFEIPNQLTWQSEYQQLYHNCTSILERRNSASMMTSVSPSAHDVMNGAPSSGIRALDASEDQEESDDEIIKSSPEFIVPAPRKLHFGVNVILKTAHNYQYTEASRFWRLSLFWWILVLIIAPMLLTNVGIYLIVSRGIANTVERWLLAAEEKSLDLEIEALKATAALKATQAQMAVGTVVGDLFMMTRLAGWLFFGGVARSRAFTRMEELTQECRGYRKEEDSINPSHVCPVFSDEDRTPCACEWRDLRDLECMDTNFTDSRTLQHRFFYVQARDYDNATGNRDKATSFGPGVDDSSLATEWWDDVDAVPGHEKGSNASGFETTYDRIRVSSAMAVVEIPLFNYVADLGYKKHFLSAFVAFDADGMMTGYSGCSYKPSSASVFESDNSNRAYEIAPDLCPLGKFGYDARCRDWYSKGKSFYKELAQPVHITAPYAFAFGEDQVAASATSPVANPATGEYVGQTLLDYSPHALYSMFDGLADTLAFLVTPDEDDTTGGDTVVGPEGFVVGPEGIPISDVLFFHEGKNSSNRETFNNGILQRMKRGERGVEEFLRVSNKEGTIGTVKIAYEPVNVTVHLPLDPSDFSHGTNTSTIQVYSVGIAYAEQEIRGPWKTIEADISSDIMGLQEVYRFIVLGISVLFIATVCHITVKVTKPMITLLTIVQTINVGTIDDDIPPLMQGGSREIHQVYNSFSKLVKIIRVSNNVFYLGNPAWAHSLLKEALTLFKKINDRKAIGIACSNLGNTLHAMCSKTRYVDECCAVLPGICMVKDAHKHYNEAIEIAQYDFDYASNPDEKAECALQLADRLFNRGMFLLLVSNDKCAPINARDVALSDIAKTRGLDYDVKDYWLNQQLLFKHSGVYFNRLIRRTLGLYELSGDEEVRAAWDLEELVEAADQFLFTAWDQPSAPLFEHMTRVGRLQQLESLAMLVDMRNGRTTKASSLAMRMFVEDEYILESAFKIAATVLLKHARDEDEPTNGWSSTTRSSVKADLRKMLRTCKQTDLDVGKCLVIAMEISKRWEGVDLLLDKVNVNLLKLYDDCCLNDDHMGLVTYDTHVSLSEKSENEGLQRTSLDLASSSASGRYSPLFPSAVQMLADSTIPREVDSYILLLTDGASWDDGVLSSLKPQIARTNRERQSKIHVLILGMGLNDTTRACCRAICTVSKKSMYMDIEESNVDSSFESVKNVIRGCVEGGAEGLTMEKF